MFNHHHHGFLIKKNFFQDSVFREEGCEESIKKARRIANLARFDNHLDAIMLIMYLYQKSAMMVISYLYDK